MLRDFSALLWGVVAVGALVAGVYLFNKLERFLKSRKDEDVKNTLGALKTGSDVLPTRFKKNEPAVNIATQDGTGVYTIRESELKNASRFQRDLLKAGFSVEIVEKMGGLRGLQALTPIGHARLGYDRIKRGLSI